MSILKFRYPKIFPKKIFLASFLVFSIVITVAYTLVNSYKQLNFASLSSSASNIVGNYENSLATIGHEIVEYNLACDKISPFLKSIKSKKQYAFENLPKDTLSLKWQSNTSSCSANALGYSTDATQAVSNIMQLEKLTYINADAITKLKLLNIHKMVFNSAGKHLGTLSLSTPIEDIQQSIVADSPLLTAKIKPHEENTLTTDIYINKEYLLCLVLLRVSVVFTILSLLFVFSCFLCSLTENHYKRRHIKNLRMLKDKSALETHILKNEKKDLESKLTKTSKILKSVYAQRKVSKKISQNMSVAFSDMTRLFDELYLTQSSKRNKAETKLFEKFVNILSVKANPSIQTNINLHELINIVISVHQEDAIKYKIKLNGPTIQKLTAALRADELRLTMAISGIVGKMLALPIEDSAINIEIEDNDESLNIIFGETNGFCIQMEESEVLNEESGFNDLARPSWQSTQKIIEFEGYNISEDFCPSNGRIFILTIPNSNYEQLDEYHNVKILDFCHDN